MARKSSLRTDDDRAKGAPTAGAEGAAPAAASPEAGLMLHVTGPIKGRRRIGRQFGPVVVSIPFADLTEEQIAALRDDPVLTIEIGPPISGDTPPGDEPETNEAS